jgi:ubiquinone/menaquinone biosynthesis C-methylase UbiE
LVYADIRDAVDVQFYLKKIKQTKGPVLEIGVGTGRIFRRALAAGADIYGFDVSPSMLKYLKKNVAPSEYYRLSQQSAVDFIYDRQFDLIIAPFRVFSHIVHVDDQLLALQNCQSIFLAKDYFYSTCTFQIPKSWLTVFRSNWISRANMRPA